MIQEIINFTKLLDEDFKNIGSLPKEGLHILIKQKMPERTISPDLANVQYEIFSKQYKGELSEFLEHCKMLQQNSWCINTNKCFDLPLKAIHTCSPFSVAFKKEHLIGEKKYNENKSLGKKQIYDRFRTYFEKAFNLFETEEEKMSYYTFKQFFTNNQFSEILKSINKTNSEKRIEIQSRIKSLKESAIKESEKKEKTIIKENIIKLEKELSKVKEIDDSDYILFYLDVSIEEYKNVYDKYLNDKLFNTDKHNTQPDEKGIIYGTNDFMNSLNSNMPFLIHQTASFDIPSRISNLDAKLLNDFKFVLQNNKNLSKTLPIFIYQEELQKKLIAIVKEGKSKLTYKEIIEQIFENHNDDLHNYYLLSWQNTKDGIEFNDFDFVSKFKFKITEYTLINFFELKEKGKKEIKHYPSIENIFDIENMLFKPLLQNKYKNLDYFNDFNKENYSTLDRTFITYSKYRKAVFDYVYKSQHKAIQLESFNEMVFSAIIDDIKNANEYGVKEKLNIWYSFYELFNPNKTHTKMASKLKEYQQFVDQLISDENKVEGATDEIFAFTAGQVIDYILKKSKSSDSSFQLLEPYLQQAKCSEFTRAISNDFARYKHEYFSIKFERAAAFVLSYETDKNLKHLLPQLLSGVFSNNQLYISNLKNQKENE